MKRNGSCGSLRLTHVAWGQGDNYAYLVTDETTKDSVIIDPAYPKEFVMLTFVFTTSEYTKTKQCSSNLDPTC